MRRAVLPAALQVDVFFVYYPKRLSQVLLVDAPWVFRPGWEMVRPVGTSLVSPTFTDMADVRRSACMGGTDCHATASQAHKGPQSIHYYTCALAAMHVSMH
jgi:hypothetical protein